MKAQARNTPIKKGKTGLLFVVSGPSGSGKTTLVKRLFDSGTLRKKLVRSISMTTRPRRSGERDKKEYFFVGKREFLEKRKSKKILEWTKYLGYYYATPKEFIEKQLETAKSVVLCLDLKGASALRRWRKRDTVTVFVMPPSLDVLLHRISKRCHLTKEEEIRQRLKLARGELQAAGRYDHCLVNQDLEDAVRQLRSIILEEIKKRLAK